MGGLRAELMGGPPPATPEFAVVLPAGWSEFDPTEAVEGDLTGRARERFMQAHRPDLFAELRGMTKRAFAGMRSSQTLKFYIQTEMWADELILPLSLTATLRSQGEGFTLDAGVTDLIRRYGATPLGGDRRFVRWETESTERLGADEVSQFTVSYLTPVPGTERKQALQFTAVAVVPADGSLKQDDPLVRSMFELTDAVVSTLSWRA